MSLLLLFAVITSIIVLFFFNVGIFEILGIEYDSWKSILLFYGLSLISDAVVTIVLMFIKINCSIVGRNFRRLHEFILRVVLNFTAVHTIDEYMSSIRISFVAEVVFAIIISTIDILMGASKRDSVNPRSE
ncbi:YrvL family regulatory protein [Paenibacillus sp. NAIST15-1]|uniref:YrvL family regulatory protein n=1 Tax=Paenibacillus sp. NAIST15-1 TaxID=1605994 RepID=UPI001D0F55F6|nr:YrvL family regulatory protein [Paenibacillus sp. NAIST15-1]